LGWRAANQGFEIPANGSGNGAPRRASQEESEEASYCASRLTPEPSNATPAISGGQIFLRTDRHLYCIAED
jgi:hypothetical protein